MESTNTEAPDYFHKVVDCQWACPAHTPVPEYIRLIAQGRYDDAYMVNWVSNVFPGILGRTCDRPCEPACRSPPWTQISKRRRRSRAWRRSPRIDPRNGDLPLLNRRTDPKTARDQRMVSIPRRPIAMKLATSTST